MIEFKTGRKQPMPLIFANVEMDQFFIDEEGQLCQKYDSDRKHLIALANGEPCANYECITWDTPVQRILPRVTKINFPGMEQ